MPRGRPPLAPADRPYDVRVRLSPAVAEEVIRLARRQQRSLYAFVGGIVDQVITRHLNRGSTSACYGEDSSGSTLSEVLSESPSQGRVGRSAASDR